MKKNFKKITLLGLAAGFFCLSAQEALTDNKEISMQYTGEKGGSPTPDDCRGAGEVLGLEGRKNYDDCDYDVYTVGEAREDDSGRESSRSRYSRSDRSKSNDSCGTPSRSSSRKGAAKIAQE